VDSTEGVTFEEVISEGVSFESGDLCSLEEIDNIPMEKLMHGACGDDLSVGSYDITSISLDTVLDLLFVVLACF
jgi:hypothetical protein